MRITISKSGLAGKSRWEVAPSAAGGFAKERPKRSHGTRKQDFCGEEAAGRQTEKEQVLSRGSQVQRSHSDHGQPWLLRASCAWVPQDPEMKEEHAQNQGDPAAPLSTCS